MAEREERRLVFMGPMEQRVQARDEGAYRGEWSDMIGGQVLQAQGPVRISVGESKF